MLLVDVETRPSKISEVGVFSKQFIKKGTIISFFFHIKLMSEKQYQEEQSKGNIHIIKTCCRYVGSYFLYGDETEGIEEYFNHSLESNVLYHCGICFAKKDIQIGDELTLNYQYILAHNDVCRFEDSETKTLVDGLNPTQSLINSAKELLELYDGTTLLD